MRVCNWPAVEIWGGTWYVEAMDWRLLRPALCSLVLAVAHAADANCRGEAPAYDLKGAQATDRDESSGTTVDLNCKIVWLFDPLNG